MRRFLAFALAAWLFGLAPAVAAYQEGPGISALERILAVTTKPNVFTAPQTFVQGINLGPPSGYVTLLGSGGGVATLPNNTGTILENNLSQSISATQTFTGTLNVSGTFKVTGTTLPTQSAGLLGIGGIAATPTFGANGEGDIWLTTAGGVNIGGEGSTNDITLISSGGSTACVLPNSSTAWNCGSFVPTGSVAPTVGMALPASGTLGLYGTTSELFTGSTDVWDYGVTTASMLTFATKVAMSALTSGSGTSALCHNTTSNQIETDTSSTICGFSAAYAKNIIPGGDITPDEADAALAALPTHTWRYKSTAYGDPNLTHAGLIADDVAAMNPDCGSYNSKTGRLVNYEDRCVLEYVIADLKKIRADVAHLQAK